MPTDDRPAPLPEHAELVEWLDERTEASGYSAKFAQVATTLRSLPALIAKKETEAAERERAAIAHHPDACDCKTYPDCLDAIRARGGRR